MIMAWIFLQRRKGGTWHGSACAADIFHCALQSEQMEDEGAAFAFHHMLCCAPGFTVTLKTPHKIRKPSVTGGWLSHVFSWGRFTTKWRRLTQLRPWLWRSTKSEDENVQTKECDSLPQFVLKSYCPLSTA